MATSDQQTEEEEKKQKVLIKYVSRLLYSYCFRLNRATGDEEVEHIGTVIKKTKYFAKKQPSETTTTTSELP